MLRQSSLPKHHRLVTSLESGSVRKGANKDKRLRITVVALSFLAPFIMFFFLYLKSRGRPINWFWCLVLALLFVKVL